MNKNKINHFLEYLSPILIISYFFNHNIFLVLIGITFSLYIINIEFINNFKKSISKDLASKKVTRDINKNYSAINADSIQIKLIKENSTLTLVETVEELGFIPSIDKNNDSKAA